MEFPKLNFNHEEENFMTSMGLEEKHYDLAKYTILFEMMSVVILQEELDINIPNGTTKSSVLEKCINRFEEDPRMLFMSVLMFESIYTEVKDQLTFLHDLTKKADKTSKDGDKSIEIFKLKADSLEDAVLHIRKLMGSQGIAEAMSFLKDCKCDYDKFIDYTVNDKSRSEVLGEEEDSTKRKSRKKKKENFDDIDEMIRKAFMNKDEDEDDED
jgi:hypothetical protein